MPKFYLSNINISSAKLKIQKWKESIPGQLGLEASMLTIRYTASPLIYFPPSGPHWRSESVTNGSPRGSPRVFSKKKRSLTASTVHPIFVFPSQENLISRNHEGREKSDQSPSSSSIANDSNRIVALVASSEAETTLLWLDHFFLALLHFVENIFVASDFDLRHRKQVLWADVRLTIFIADIDIAGLAISLLY